jgi:hypothetical protein
MGLCWPIPICANYAVTVAMGPLGSFSSLYNVGIPYLIGEFLVTTGNTR